MRKQFTNKNKSSTTLALLEIKKSWQFIEPFVTNIQNNLSRQDVVEVRYCSSPCFDDEDFNEVEDDAIQHSVSKMLSLFRRKNSFVGYTDEVLIKRIGSINDLSVLAERLPDVFRQLIYDTLILTSTLRNGISVEASVVEECIKIALIDVLRSDIGLHNLATLYKNKLEFMTKMLVLLLLDGKKCSTDWTQLAARSVALSGAREVRIKAFSDFSRNDIMNIPYSIATRIDLPMIKHRIESFLLKNQSLTYLIGHRVVSGLDIALSFLYSRFLSGLSTVDNNKTLSIYISKELDEQLYRSITNNLKTLLNMR
jgi:hypothetical protein